MLFIDFSSAFNTIIPQQLIHKPNLLGLITSLCNWILDFLTARPHRVGRNTSSTTTLSTGAPQGCVLSPLLFTLLIHDCTAKSSSNHIIKFADDTTVVGLIRNNDEMQYREEVAQLAEWCGANNLSLNVGKTKEVVMDFRRNSVGHWCESFIWYKGHTSRRSQSQWWLSLLEGKFTTLCLRPWYFAYVIQLGVDAKTFSIIIILPTLDRDWDGVAACHTKSLTAGAPAVVSSLSPDSRKQWLSEWPLILTNLKSALNLRM